MFNAPPTSIATAIPSLARASEYANAIIGAGNQTAEIRMAPGLYDPASVWQCNVRFVAYNSALTTPLWASNSVGAGSTPNNYFDGSGWDDFSADVNFGVYRLVLRDSLSAGNTLSFVTQPRAMIFDRSVDFIGGFHCLGLAETIKAVGNGLLPRELFLGGVSPMPDLASFTATLSTNVDTLLSAIRTTNGRTAPYGSSTAGSFIVVRSEASDNVRLRDLVIGPGLPSRKTILGGSRDPLIVVQGLAAPQLLNFYIRGKTRITSAGMGVTGDLPQANASHYGTAAVTTPWAWEQTYHTLLGVSPSLGQPISLILGGSVRYNTNPAIAGASTYYQDESGKLLPNHIHLLDNAGAVPADNDTGPFFDQFIHAPQGLFVVQAWPSALEGDGVPILPRLQGFVGKFGSNAYNTTKTRGVIGGNSGVGNIDSPEEGFTFSLLALPVANGGLSIFQRAGVAVGSTNLSARPTYNDQSQAFGTGFPTGANPVITTDTSGGAALNVGLRSFRKGISAEFAITIVPSNAIL
jgi:hypothetical protein